ncbi:MAG TPA: alpha/beta fold hydrolase [Azospirillaceae bacterium]|nr:alpha/beta fold hydrolase [Azospirillaceae bacterium]
MTDAPPPLLLLPGMLCDARLWSDVRGRLGADVGEVRVPDLDRQVTIAEMADDVLAQAPGRFALAGFSMGAIVALEIARRAPERLSHLMLMNTTARPDTAERKGVRARQIYRAQTGGFRDVVVEDLKPRYFAPGTPNLGNLRRLVIGMALDLGVDVFRRQSLALMGRPDSRPTLSAIATPTLVIAADGDDLCPVEIHEEIHRLIPGSRLTVLRHCGHMAPLERPVAVAAALTEFLTS